MRTRTALCLALGLMLTACSSTANRPTDAEVRFQVNAAERAFARTMATRDLQGFARYVADDAVFIADEVPLRGRQQIVAAWEPLFQGAEAPFSWEPEIIEVLRGGTYAISTGPVRDPAGRIVMRFTSLWRQDVSGAWQVVFDQGCRACD